MSAKPQTYGAVAQGEDVSLDREPSYDIDNTYYVKERTLSRKERCQQIMLVALPLLAAFIIIGGFALYLLRDAHILSPEPGGGGSTRPAVVPRSSSGEGPYPEAPKPAPAPEPAAKKVPHSSNGSASCASNAKCKDLGLLGECCPTAKGEILDCCN